MIAEFMAENDGALVDGDGNASDWIELYNAGDESIDLAGWHLTDDGAVLDKWTFPSQTLGGGEFLVVFASDQPIGGYQDAAGNPHSNFALDSKGGYLALVRPDLTVAHQFVDYPHQRANVSFGTAMSTSVSTLVAEHAQARTLVPTGPVAGWEGGDPLFDDTAFADGEGNTTGVGYADSAIEAPGLLAEWTFETSGGVEVSAGQSALGQIDETAGDAAGPFLGTASGAAAGDALNYTADVPPALPGSQHALEFPAPENAQNHVAISLDSSHPIANMPQGDFRVEAWFKTTDPDRNVLVGSYVGAPTSLNLELHTSNRGRIYVQGPSGTTDLNVTLPTNSRDGEWHHLVGLREGNMVRLLYDGATVGTRPDVAASFTISQPWMYLGRDSRTGSTIFNGALDGVRFYASADTSALVASYEFETSRGIPISDGQNAAGQVDDSGAIGPFHGAGFIAAGIDGVNYAQDAPSVLPDSHYSLDLDESNLNAESFTIGMPAPIAELTLGDFTLQTWFKTNDTERAILMGSYTGADNALNFELHTSNRLRVYIQNVAAGTTDLNLPLPTNSRDGNWHSASVTRQGQRVELFYDGQSVGSTTDVAGSYVQTAANYFFGRDSRTGSTRFDGQLDNVRFWNLALTPQQIAELASGFTPAQVTGASYDSLIQTDVEAEMRDQNASALIRIPFEVSDPAQFSSLRLRMKYDDGFVAYLNGREVASSNAPASAQWDSTAAAARPPELALEYADFDVYSPRELLVAGANLLAIQGLNASAADDRFLILPQLQALTTSVDLATNLFFPAPSAGAVNNNGVLGFVSDTSFSVDRGFYSTADLAPGGVLEEGVMLTTETPDAVVRYTTDGSWPTSDHGQVYASPIPLSTTTTLRAAAFREGFQPTNVDTHTYIFLSDVLQQPDNPAGFPAEWQSGHAADYGMDSNVVLDPAYQGRIEAALQSIPTMSIVMDVNDAFDQTSGIYANSEQKDSSWERGMSLEYFDPANPDREFQLNSAVRMHGKGSRFVERSLKHNLRAIFKEPYGPTKLSFPLFPGSPVDRFDTIVLRAGYNYSWNHNSATQRQRAQYLRDTFARETYADMGNLSVRGDYVHLYLNGLYWGVYQLNERPDASFLAEHLGGDKSDYDALNGDDVIDGDRDAWDELLRRARQDLTDSANYEAVRQYLDVDNLIDYMLLQIYSGTTDWPISEGQITNYYAGRRREPGAGFQFFVWDGEHTQYDLNVNRTGVNDSATVAELYARLRANPEFNLAFADHVQRHFFGDGSLTPQANLARYQDLAEGISEALIGESARWGDQKGQATPHTVDNEWVAERDWLVNTYFPQRTAVVLDQLRAANLYPDTSAPAFLLDGLEHHGGAVFSGQMLSLEQIGQATQDVIYYTLDGTDPRLPGGAVNPNALAFSQTLPLQETTTVKTRALTAGGQWSAINAATFIISAANAENLRVTEIMFNPLDPSPAELAVNPAFNNDDFEFLELENIGVETISMAGVAFTSGIRFEFPELNGWRLAPGQRTLLVSNLAAFETRYGAGSADSVAGQFASGKLSNDGELLVLLDHEGQVIQSFRFDDAENWPQRADGDGSSLVVIDPQGDYNEGSNWRASSRIGGSPADAADEPIVGVVINEILAHTDPPALDSVELYNYSTASVDLTNWYLSDSNDNHAALQKYKLPSLIIAAGEFLVFDEDDFNPTLGQNPNDFSLSSLGDELWLTRGDGVRATHFVDQLQFGPTATGQSIGRWPNGSGEFIAMGELTLGAENTGPAAEPPIVLAVEINRGIADPPNLPRGPQPSSWQVQRSTISNVVVTFSRPVNEITTVDLVLMNLGVNAPLDDDRQITLDPSQLLTEENTLTIDFSAHALPTGVYQLQLLAGVTDLTGAPLDGNADGTAGDPFVYQGGETNRFHSLPANFNEDSGVSIFDFSTFAYWFGVNVPTAPAYADLNADGGVTIFDFPIFAGNFGIGVVYSAPPVRAEWGGQSAIPSLNIKSGRRPSMLRSGKGLSDDRSELRDAALLSLLAQWQAGQPGFEVAARIKPGADEGSTGLVEKPELEGFGLFWSW